LEYPKARAKELQKKNGLHAYQFTVVHELKGPDHEKRMVTAVGCHQLLNATF
jgi:hypothetical protein